MTTKDEVREEFMKDWGADWEPQGQIFYSPANKEGYMKDGNLVADWWISKFDTLLAKKREEIAELKKEIIKKEGGYTKDWSKIGEVVYYYLDRAESILS